MVRVLRSLASLAARTAYALGSLDWLIVVLGVPAALLTRDLLALIAVGVFVVVSRLVRLTVRLLWRSSEAPLPRQRFTGSGRIYLALSLAFCVVSIPTEQNLLYMTTALMASLLLASAMAAALTIKGLKVKPEFPEHIFAGEPFSVNVAVRNGKRWFPSSLVTVTGLWQQGDPRRNGSQRIQRILPGESSLVNLRRVVRRRGRQRMEALTVATSYPYGFVEVWTQAAPRREVLALPRMGTIRWDALVRRLGQQREWRWLASARSEPGDFRSLREYRYGDNVRDIHWPTSARMRKLYVQERDRRNEGNVLLVLDAVMPSGRRPDEADAERFERAVSVIASLARVFLHKDISYGFASCCPQPVRIPCDAGLGHFYSVLEALAEAEPAQADTPEDLLAALRASELSEAGILIVSAGAGHQFRRPGCVHLEVDSPVFQEMFEFDGQRA